uniref:XRN2-binding (XTBD) domain-containing protein n=1 Tax=Globodera pallida TaxID=36090 RepID=A0A183C7U5_GLOPA
MKKENADSPKITQILEEIGEESADFERHMKARTANWEAAKNQQMIRENNFLLAFGRLYCKLSKASPGSTLLAHQLLSQRMLINI